MSVEAMAWAFKQILDPSQKIVLLALAHACDGNGRCWLAKRDIAELTGLSQRSIINIIRALCCAERLISRQQRFGPDGRCISNVYELHLCSHKKYGPSVSIHCGVGL